MFRSFFPSPVNFFVSALAWTAVCMTIWFTSANGALQSVASLGPWLGIAPTEAVPEPFFSSDKVWLYQFVIMAGVLFCIPWFFLNDNRRWYWWSVPGTVLIIEVVYFNVQVDAWLNDWYGDFYNMIQTSLEAPNTFTFDEYMAKIFTVAVVLAVNIFVLVLNAFFSAHYLFRWRRAMTFFYMANWQRVRTIEGASQRIQEDSERFADIVQGIGLTIVSSIMTLLVFLPILWALSDQIPSYPFIGPVPGGLVWLALGTAIAGTLIFAAAGLRLPGLQFANQRVEAAFRKELVYGEDAPERGQPLTVRELFRNVQRNQYRIYLNYTYFNVFRYGFLNAAQFFPYIALGPSIVTGAITLGIFRQVFNAYGSVNSSFSFLMNSWTTIINLISIYQRLRGFERQIPKEGFVLANDYDDPRYLATETVPAAQTPVVVPE